MASPNIVLIGLRASGKTTLGQMLAERLGRVFVDLDEVTAAMMGCVDVPEAWAMQGPGAFRAAEAHALKCVLENPGQIIALGGGTPTAPGASAHLREHAALGTARIIYLRALPETLRTRLESTDLTDRPSLTGAGVIDEVDQVFKERDANYAALATTVLEVDALSPSEAMERLSALS